MTGIVRIFAPVLALMLALALPAQAAPVMGVVDVQKVLKESKAAGAARAHLEQARAALQMGLDALEAEYKGAPEAERRRVLSEGLMTLNRQMSIEEQAANQVVLQMMQEEAAKWRASSKASCVITLQNLLDADKSVDVTDKIIAAMNKRTPKFAELPRVDGKKREAPKAEAQKPDPKKKK